ncbi:transcription elongation factor SPT6 [Vigna unguiculata]|uniref:Transcription elongation factor SPT6 n=1 Tax=Vigna unguiculata TaxID=3917 RepID=A0A4D6NCY4_VIGUN|nr:transcription elongation factor SPT6 [Vigna unguiculata]
MAISFRSSSIMAIPDEERQDKYENDEFIADDIEDEEEQDEEEKANTDDERQKKKKRKNKEEYVLDEDDYELREDNNINIRPSKESQRFKRLKKDRTDTEEESSGMSDKDEFVCGYKGAPLQDSAEGEEQGEEEEDADTSTDLSSEFGNYFCNSGLTKVVLHGPFFQVECNLLFQN